MSPVHRVIASKIHYYRTPVVLISTVNADSSVNLAPMSSAWWLGQRCLLGLCTEGKTYENLVRERECVLNLPSADLVDAVDRLALTTGSKDMPEYKRRMNFRYVPDKFEEAGLTPAPAELVEPPRVAECPIQLEAAIERFHPVGEPHDHLGAIEARILRLHVDERLLDAQNRHHIDPSRWRPLVMSFLEFYTLGAQIHPSRLAEVF